MTDSFAESPKPFAAGRVLLQVALSLIFALGLCVLAAWLLLRPVREPAHLTPFEPRPEILDKPHRNLAVPAVSASSGR